MTRKADRHPTLDDPSPLDCCGWCYDWIVGDAFVVPLTGRPQPEGQMFAEMMIDDCPVLGIVPQPGASFDADVVVVLCSQACADRLQQAIDRDRRRALGEAVAPYEPSAAERLEAEQLVADVCAWCHKALGTDDPAIDIFATLTGPGPRVPGMSAILIDGRLVPGRVPESGSAAELPGGDIGFKLCGDHCAEALTAAIDRDLTLRILH